MIKLPNPISRVCDPLIMPRHNDDEAEVCLRCGGFGHDMTLCKYEYSHEDLKVTLSCLLLKFSTLLVVLFYH